jgi:phosphatidyl-myo-inositol dimannoside synthase
MGGIQEVLGRLAEGLTSAWDVTAIAPYQEHASQYDARVSFDLVRTRQRWHGLARAGVLAEMTAKGRRARPDLIFMGHLAIAPAATAVAGRRPMVALIHGSELWAQSSQLALRLAKRRLTLALAVSRFTAAEASKAGVPPERMRVTPLAAVAPADPEDGEERLAELGLVDPYDGTVYPFFLTLARLVEPHKGQDVFIRALPALLSRNPRLRYVVAGDGPLRSHLARIAASVGVTEAVRFVGAVDGETKGALMRACTALVMLSRETPAAGAFEGFGIVYLEAALAGRPSIAGDAGGAPEAVLGGETGLLVDPRSVAAAVDAASRLLEAPAYADELGERARRHAEKRYTWDHALRRVNAALLEALDSL